MRILVLACLLCFTLPLQPSTPHVTAHNVIAGCLCSGRCGRRVRVRAPCTRVHGVSLRVAFTRDGSGHIGDLEMSVRRRACKRACTHACLTPLTTCYGTDTGRQGGCIHRTLRSRVARTAQFAGGEAAAGAHGVWARCARPLRVVRACVRALPPRDVVCLCAGACADSGGREVLPACGRGGCDCALGTAMCHARGIQNVCGLQ